MKKNGRPPKYDPERVRGIMRDKNCTRQYAYAILRMLDGEDNYTNVAAFSSEECNGMIRACKQRLAQLGGDVPRAPSIVSDHVARMVQARVAVQAAKKALEADPKNPELQQRLAKAEAYKEKVRKEG